MVLSHIAKYQSYRVGCQFRVSKNVSESYFLGMFASNRMDLEGVVNLNTYIFSCIF